MSVGEGGAGLKAPARRSIDGMPAEVSGDVVVVPEEGGEDMFSRAGVAAE